MEGIRAMSDWQPNSNDTREDGSQKGSGWLGVKKRPDGRVSSELSIGASVNGKDQDVPSMVPTLTKEEVNYLLNTDPKDLDFRNNSLGKSIASKAIQHAESRDDEGKSPFANERESKAASAANDDAAEEKAMIEAFGGKDDN